MGRLWQPPWGGQGTFSKSQLWTIFVGWSFYCLWKEELKKWLRALLTQIFPTEIIAWSRSVDIRRVRAVVRPGQMEHWTWDVIYVTVSHLFIPHSSFRITFKVLMLFSGTVNREAGHAFVTTGSPVFLYENNLNTKRCVIKMWETANPVKKEYWV